MTEIVPIGIAFDARPVLAGVKALDDLTASAKPAGAAAAALEKAIAPAAAAVESLSTAAGSSRGLTTLATGLKAVTAATSPASAALTKLQKQINAVTGVNLSLGGSGGANRGSDVAAYGAELDSLRAKYNPLFAAQQSYKSQLTGINQAAKVGAITEAERAAAITDTKIAFIQQVESIKGTSAAYDALGKSAPAATNAAAAGTATVTKQTALARHELINLSRQFQDVGVSLASGQSPLLVAIQQGTQIADVFASSTGTVGGFFKQVASGLSSIVTPARLVVGGIAAIGTTAALAAMSWTGAQRDIQIGLMGIGRASKVTAGDINAIAEATSSANGLSVSESREVATALASTGKIGVDNIQRLTANTKNFAVALGMDVPKAAEAMATIFANPTEGAKQLAARIGGIDSVTLKLIETLEQQGDRQGAIKALADATIPAISGAAEKTGNLAKGWNLVSNAASNAFTAIGKALNQIGTSGLDQNSESVLDKQRKDLEALIQTYQKANLPADFMQSAFDQLVAVNDQLMKLQANRKSATAVDAAQTTLQVAPIVSALAPAPDIVRTLTSTVELLNKTMADPAQADFVKRLGDQLPLAAKRAQDALTAIKGNMRLADPVQSQIDNLTIQNKLLDNQSPAMRSRVAYQLAYRDAIKSTTEEEARQIAALRGAQAYGGRATDIQQEQTAFNLFGQTPTAKEADQPPTEEDDNDGSKFRRAA